VTFSQTWLRVAGGLTVFLSISLIGLAGLSGLDFDEALDWFSLVMAIAIPAGILVYAGIEFAQTRRIHSITRQFDTRTLVLMPVAISLNIVLGTVVASALKIPIYLDSIGTILVAALAGPLAGALTGFLANIIWTGLAPPPFESPFAAPFAVVAVVVGLMAGTFARWGWLRPRPSSSDRLLLIGGAASITALVVMGVLALGAWNVMGEGASLAPESDDAAFLILGWLVMALIVGTGIGLVVLLARRRDLAAAYIVLAGVVTGVVAAFVAAPIAAGIFGGVTGSGADFVIAAFRQAGADLEQAVLGQSLISDPIDKVITYFVVYLILGAMSRRVIARFPQGAVLLPLPDDEEDDDADAQP
jgi:hypothetical protein